MQSPLLTNESPLFPLYFEFGAPAVGVCSPQVPTGNERDLCEGNGIDGKRIETASERLRTFGATLRREELERKLGACEAALPMLGALPTPGAGTFADTSPDALLVLAPPPQQGVTTLPPSATQQSAQEFANRQRAMVANVNSYTELNGNALARASEKVGALLPVWLDGPGDGQLVFARRVHDATGTRVQGMLVDWPYMQTELLRLVGDLYPDAAARFVRCEQPKPEEQPSMLASVPARLVAECRDEFVSGLPLPVILGTTWGVTLVALVVLWITLRAAIGFGERRARFASAVTHELRTPLTTFRMYSEMLADGVVKEPEAQREYLTTLQRESDRLARVVENVLAWSRLEEGRFTARRVKCEVGPLLDRLVPTLQRRLGEAGLQLVVDVAAGAHAASVTTDEDAVGQILFNLIDNAAKYAREAADKRVELAAAVDGERVSFAVRDHGPGVPTAVRERIFAPFDRGVVAAGSNEVPGVGLGLALARGLARDLGGDLRLDGDASGGARFVLDLPMA